MLRRFSLALFAFSCTVSAMAGAPPEVGDRFAAAEAPSDTVGFVGTYTMTTQTTVQKPNGKSRKDVEMAMEMDHGTDGEQSIHLIRFMEDGEDMTEERRAEIEGSDNGENAEDGDNSDDEDFVEPFSDLASRFTFGPPRIAGSTVEMDFSPKKEHSDEQGMASGTMAWNADTLDPLWVVYDVQIPPKPLRELSVRVEYERLGDTVFVSRFVFEGLAKVLLMKRQFHTDVRWHDIVPGS